MTFLKLFFWLIKESVKFCLFLFLLFQFTSLSIFVEPRSMAIGLAHVAKNGWTRIHDSAARAVYLVRTAAADTGKDARHESVSTDTDSLMGFAPKAG